MQSHSGAHSLCSHVALGAHGFGERVSPLLAVVQGAGHVICAVLVDQLHVHLAVLSLGAVLRGETEVNGAGCIYTD